MKAQILSIGLVLISLNVLASDKNNTQACCTLAESWTDKSGQLAALHDSYSERICGESINIKGKNIEVLSVRAENINNENAFADYTIRVKELGIRFSGEAMIAKSHGNHFATKGDLGNNISYSLSCSIF